MKKKVLFISIIVLFIDQLSKILIGINIGLNESFIIISNFFSLTNVNNEGAAFSVLNGHVLLFIFIGLIAIFLLYKYIDDFKYNKRNVWAFGLLLGGIVGNLVDRICFGYVRDFLSFRIFNYNYPVFNIGDSAIVIGVILLLIAVIKGEDYGSKRKK